MKFNMEERSLYLCTSDRDDLGQFVTACIKGGVDIVQLREKRLEARQLLERAVIVRDICRDHGVPFVMNDRPDLALACEADGVHLGQDDVSVKIARSLLGSDAIVGLSTHHPDEFTNGLGEEVDYLSVGPIVETPTKPGREPTGIGYVSQARDLADHWPGRETPLPFFVTGGVTPEAIPAIVRAGAKRFVVVRYLTQSDDPLHAAQRLKEAIARANA